MSASLLKSGHEVSCGRELIQLWVSGSPEVSVFAPVCPCSWCLIRALVLSELKHLQHQTASWCLWARWSHSRMHKHASKVRKVCLTWLSKNMQNRLMDTKSITAFAIAIWAHNSTAAKQHSHSTCKLSKCNKGYGPAYCWQSYSSALVQPTSACWHLWLHFIKLINICPALTLHAADACLAWPITGLLPGLLAIDNFRPS